MKRITTSRTKNEDQLYPVCLDGVEIGGYRMARDCGETVCRFFPGGKVTADPWQFVTVWEMRNSLPFEWAEEQRRLAESRSLHRLMNPVRRFKMRFEATSDLCRFLNLCAAKAVSLHNFESDRMDVVAFDTDLTLSEIRELLDQITDGHVMAGTVAPIADFTGERTA